MIEDSSPALPETLAPQQSDQPLAPQPNEAHAEEQTIGQNHTEEDEPVPMAVPAATACEGSPAENASPSLMQTVAAAAQPTPVPSDWEDRILARVDTRSPGDILCDGELNALMERATSVAPAPKLGSALPGEEDLVLTPTERLDNLRLFNLLPNASTQAEDPDSLPLTGAAVLLFARQPQEWVPGAFVHLVLHAPNGKVLRDEKVCGPLSRQLTTSLHLLAETCLPAQHRRTRRVFLRRALGPDATAVARSWALDSLGEALTNALTHKDYSAGKPVEIHVYPDRIEVSTPCSLPAGISAKWLLNSHSSFPHNARLAAVLAQAGIATGTGSGLKTLRTRWKRLGYPVPKLILKDDTFTICFSCVPSAVSASPRKTRAATRDKGALLLPLLEADPKITIRRMAEETGLTIAAVRNVLRYLRGAGMLARVGNSRSGSWQIIPQAETTAAPVEAADVSSKDPSNNPSDASFAAADTGSWPNSCEDADRAAEPGALKDSLTQTSASPLSTKASA